MSWVDILANIPTNAVLKQKLGELTEEFKKLEARIAELEEENNELKAQIDSGAGELDDIEIAILEFLGEVGDYVPQDAFAGRLHIQPAKVEYFLNRLRKNGYLGTSLNAITGASYKLSDKGSEYLINTGRL